MEIAVLWLGGTLPRDLVARLIISLKLYPNFYQCPRTNAWRKTASSVRSSWARFRLQMPLFCSYMSLHLLFTLAFDIRWHQSNQFIFLLYCALGLIRVLLFSRGKMATKISVRVHCSFVEQLTNKYNNSPPLIEFPYSERHGKSSVFACLLVVLVSCLKNNSRSTMIKITIYNYKVKICFERKNRPFSS